ncbi:nodulation efficiency protein D-like protein [Gottschalkia acidurici 9a]|uniref:Nodulation efficiency protein D-like protein n=1 Tax=Gottschalkia acidurici (strain ATCC 7906 / DSM 604 / BCRC 14475 / CIP 104303 / KCTC 5404 / NCIMB 10678 / 9a) TaxID=1128398 RepID=K0AY99_GOTA9|nr:NfeD family protein [Gottschalkia acidurici]AFS77735.1 nodulation efficiency protein D-like protein [Gottschalkia acidurici 9a]
MSIDITEGIVWLSIAVACGIVEAITLGITSIWFVFGALAAWLLAEINAPLPLQILTFLVVSSILLYFTKPLLKNKLKVGKEKTNTDLLIGEIGVVIKNIDMMRQEGQVNVKGQIWSAKTKDEEIIRANEKVEILGIEGVKLVVKKINKEEI